MNENIFRIVAAVILFSAMGISIYFRSKADRESGEKLSRKADGTVLMTIIRIGGLILWLSPFVYLINPVWMAWSKIGLPESARWLGVGIGVLCVPGIYWLFSSIGTGITPTSATRKEHKLVTHGIYHYIRHPLYSLGSSLFISFGMMADSWFIAALGILTFILMAIRTPKEEANLIEKFGDEYREYMKRTGRFLPKLFKIYQSNIMTIELFFKITFFVVFFGFAYMMTAYTQKAKARMEDKATRVKMHNEHEVPLLLKLRQTFGIPFYIGGLVWTRHHRFGHCRPRA